MLIKTGHDFKNWSVGFEIWKNPNNNVKVLLLKFFCVALIIPLSKLKAKS